MSYLMFKDLGEKKEKENENNLIPKNEKYRSEIRSTMNASKSNKQKYTENIKDINHKIDLINANKIVVIDIWAPWCNPCLMIADKYEEMAKTYNKKGFCMLAKENLEDKIQQPEGVVIKGVPSFLFFKDGIHIDTEVGADLRTVENKLNKLLSEL